MPVLLYGIIGIVQVLFQARIFIKGNFIFDKKLI